MSVTEAHRLGCCRECGRDVVPWAWPVRDRNEYDLSALCPSCYEARRVEQDRDCE